MTNRLDELFASYPLTLDVTQLSELLGIARPTAYKWMREGRIPAYKIAGAWVVYRDEVKDALISGRNLSRVQDREDQTDP